MKICTACGETKPYEQFHRQSSSRDGFKSACKACRNSENREYGRAAYAREKDVHVERKRQWRNDHRQRVNEIAANYRERERARQRAEEEAAYLANKDVIDAEKERVSEERRIRRREYRKAHYRDNKERVLAIARKYREGYKNRERIVRKAHYEANKEHVAQVTRAYRRANLHIYAIAHAKRRAAELQATPLWANHSQIAALYAEAARLTRETGVAHHVDHVVPLQSKFVCGLHCELNMQVILGSENQSKSNRYWPDMP